MWKELLTFLQTVLTLAKEQTQIRADIKEIQGQLTHLILKVQTLNDQLIMNHEREMAAMALLRKDLEIEILKLRQELNLQNQSQTRQLPPASS